MSILNVKHSYVKMFRFNWQRREIVTQTVTHKREKQVEQLYDIHLNQRCSVCLQCTVVSLTLFLGLFFFYGPPQQRVQQRRCSSLSITVFKIPQLHFLH